MNQPTAKKPPKPHLPLRLNGVEKADGRFPGVAATVAKLYDQGVPAREVAETLREQSGGEVDLGVSVLERHRRGRWAVQRNIIANKAQLAAAIVAAFGGDPGLDVMALATLWEKMDEMTVPQIIVTREVFLRIRAQNLKEQEFLYKTGQLKVGDAAGEKVSREQQQRDVLKKVKEIFGLSSDEAPAEPAAQAADAAAQAVQTVAEQTVEPAQAAEPTETPGPATRDVEGTTDEPPTDGAETP